MPDPQPLFRALINITALLFIGIILLVGLLFYSIRMPGQSYQENLPRLDENMQALSMRLNNHVRILAEEIGERHFQKMNALENAANYIEEQFRLIGYVPKSQLINERIVRNIVVDHYGKQDRNKIIVVGAHYDTATMTPGADDNASGVAVMLEIARALSEEKLPITIRFVAFVNEEEPFYGTENMGSHINAKRSSDRNENIIGMFSLEMLGYYTDQPRSQYYPRPLRYFYPEKGNFIAFVSNLLSRQFLIDAIAAFRDKASFPSEGLAAPVWMVRDIRRSDNVSFWEYGYPAVMVTDTSNYRNWNYHNITDRHNTLDYDRMALVTEGLTKMIEALAH